MKKNTLVSLSLLFALLLSLFACRKSIEFYVDGKEAPTTSLLESAKIWRSQRINTFDKKEILKPYWNDSWTVTNSDGKTLIIVPSPERRNSNKSISIRRFFVFTAKGGGITDGNIVEFVAEKSDVKRHLDDLLKNMTKDGISNFSGWISKYDINYQFLTSYVFHNGKKSNEQSKIVILNPGKAINSGPISVTFNSKGRISAARGSVSYGSGTVDCPLITPLITGEPVPMCAQALILYRETWVADQDGCLISLVYTYFSHTCPGGLGTEGDGSGDGSGSASAEPDGSGTSEEGGNPNYGGSGQSGDAPNPCATASDRGANSTFKEKLADLRTRATTNAFESAYILKNGIYHYYNGGPTGIDFNIPNSIYQGANEMMHNHENNQNNLSIYSHDDLQTLHEIIKNGQVADKTKFAFTLTTAKGTTYMLVVNDTAKFEAWGEAVLRPVTTSDGVLEKLVKETFIQQYSNIKASNTNSANEMAFLNSLNYNGGSGLTLLKPVPSTPTVPQSDAKWGTVAKTSTTISITGC